MESRKSFMVIEVLISIFIIFMAIIIIVTSFKQNLLYNNKNEIYQDMFITVKSVVNLLDNTDIKTRNKNYELIKKININGFNIAIYAKLIKSQRNYIISSSDIRSLRGGYTGKKLYKLFKIKIVLNNKNFKKEYFYFLTKVEKL